MSGGDSPRNTSGMTRKQLLKTAAVAGAGLALPAGATSDALASVFRAPKKGGTLFVDLELESPSFNPLLNNYQHLRWVTDQVNETLYTYHGAKIVPALTTGMPKVIDQLNTQITVKPGIKFSDGHPLTAADVAATFNAARGGVTNAIWKSHLQPLASVEAVDSKTVHFTFAKPWGLLLEKMADIPIVPAHAVSLNEKIPGTGPFIFAAHTQGQSVTLKANPHYRFGVTKLS
jgi:peptide/nickel transport system substrate-binding protein